MYIIIITFIMPENRSSSKTNTVILPTYYQYDMVKTSSFKVKQLKEICDEYKLKKTGKKADLIDRIYNHLKTSYFTIKVQSVYRGYLTRRFMHSCGNALYDRNICVNDSDFLSMEPLVEIKHPQFVSFTVKANFTYGFDIISLYNLLLKDGTNATNPYTRSGLPSDLLSRLKKHIRLANILYLHRPINIEIPTGLENLDATKLIEMEALRLFQKIDELGNYSDHKWFINMTRTNIINFITELKDVWTYRLDLSNDTKRNICHPEGNPFNNIAFPMIYDLPTTIIKQKALKVIDNLINTGIDHDSQTLGSFYVLGTLTIVNSETRCALPWLYQTFSLII